MPWWYTLRERQVSQRVSFTLIVVCKLRFNHFQMPGSGVQMIVFWMYYLCITYMVSSMFLIARYGMVPLVICFLENLTLERHGGRFCDQKTPSQSLWLFLLSTTISPGISRMESCRTSLLMLKLKRSWWDIAFKSQVQLPYPSHKWTNGERLQDRRFSNALVWQKFLWRYPILISQSKDAWRDALVSHYLA